LAFSSNGGTLASIFDGMVQLWDALSWSRLHAIKDDDMAFSSVAFSADNKLLALGCESGEIVLWDLAIGERKQKFGVANSIMFDDTTVAAALALSPDGSVLATITHAGLIQFWDVSSGAEFGIIDVGLRRTGNIAFSACGSRLVTGLGEIDVP
jgi:WD40 repeat protein